MSTVRQGELDLGRMSRRKQTRHEISHLKKQLDGDAMGGGGGIRQQPNHYTLDLVT